MAAEKVMLYIKGDRNVEVTNPDVYLGDLLEMECTDKVLLAKVKRIKAIKFRKGKFDRRVISVLKIISLIHESYPQIDVCSIGETDIIATYENQKTPVLVWHIIKTILVTAIVFCGAAFSIMAFNNDVDVTKLFSQIYVLATGRETDGFTILEVTYSIGIAMGILVFFNHFGKKRFTADPTPMEVQMRLYENDIQTTLIEDAAREGEEINVDGSGKTDSSGTYRA